MAVSASSFAFLILVLLLGSAFAADPPTLFSELHSDLEVTATPSQKGGVLQPGEDKLKITWKTKKSDRVGTYKSLSFKLCYAPISQEDRPWRHTKPELKKDKTCGQTIETMPYKESGTLDWTVTKDIPTATYFLRVYALDSNGHEQGYGQNVEDLKDDSKFFQVKAISGRSTPLDIASVCFSVFSVVSLFGFFFNEKRKAKKTAGK